MLLTAAVRAIGRRDQRFSRLVRLACSGRALAPATACQSRDSVWAASGRSRGRYAPPGTSGNERFEVVRREDMTTAGITTLQTPLTCGRPSS